MTIDSQTSVSQAPWSLPPLSRLVVVGLAVPVLFSAVDVWLLGRMQHEPSNTLLVAITMAVFVVQVGLLGWLCGRWIEHPWWRWSLYAWGWVLVDLQLYTATAITDSASYWNHGRLLPGSLFAAQAGLAMVWGILGSSRWTLRIPACAPLFVVFGYMAHRGSGFAADMVPLQLLALGALCLALRGSRFRLALTTSVGTRLEAKPDSASPGAAMQFGIRHVLIWTTCLAVLLAMMRALDLLSFETFRIFDEQGVLSQLMAGIVVAAVFVVAVWAALGAGTVWLRIPVLLLSLPMAGLIFGLLNFWDRLGWSSGTTFSDLWDGRWMLLEFFWDACSWLAVWIALAGSLLFASLIILRTIGYRLVRTARAAPARRAA